jgi:hypothetical protein
MTRYPLLYAWAIVQMVLGLIIWALTAVAVIAIAVVGPDFQVDFTNPLSMFIWSVKSAGIAQVLLVGGLGGLGSLAAGQFIMMLIDMADDTRSLRVYREREVRHEITGRP